MLCEWWWGFYRSPAANSFHLPDSRRLGPSSLFFFPHGPRLDFPVRDIWENSLLLIQFSNHFHVRALLTLTWLSENSTLHICYFLSSRRKTVRVRCQGGYMVIHLSGVHPLENPCGSSLVCIFIWTATVVFQHDSSPPSSFQKKYHSKKPFCRQRGRLFRRHKSTRIVCRFRRTATAPKRSTKNVCHDSRVTKSVLFFRFVSETSSLWLQDSRTITFKWTIKSYCMWLNLE